MVSDLRAATPTDAAKKVVPDTAAELALVRDLHQRSARALRNWVAREQRLVRDLCSRPVLADPIRAVTDRGSEVHRAQAAIRRDITRFVAAETDRVEHLAARLATLGPAATLARGYAVVQVLSDDPTVLRSAADAPTGTLLRIRVSDGAVRALSAGPDREPKNK
jgi:exodeoxyribonuclease VII large subunit